MYCDDATNQQLYAAGTQTDEPLEDQSKHSVSTSYEQLRENIRSRYGGYSLAQLLNKFDQKSVKSTATA